MHVICTIIKCKHPSVALGKWTMVMTSKRAVLLHAGPLSHLDLLEWLVCWGTMHGFLRPETVVFSTQKLALNFTFLQLYHI
ncbi:hypothetical protein QCA50_009063 [Cerrena zonata]|uniref:Uncharacterized protein n=1 Tax=Cerrena zonata TaxID=2478898 RepID=A0AAW0G902_9APHY